MKTQDQVDAQKREDILISANVATWEFRIEGDYSGTFSGTFKFRTFLSPTKKIAVGREQRELLGSVANLASNEEAFLAVMLTQLKYRILEAPPFWAANTGSGYAGDLLDENVLAEVFTAALDSELKYKAILIDRKMSAVSKAKDAAESIQNSRDEKVQKKTDDKEQEEEF